jgi:glycosyltransferase involved in cell wall biosynthesis
MLRGWPNGISKQNSQRFVSKSWRPLFNASNEACRALEKEAAVSMTPASLHSGAPVWTVNGRFTTQKLTGVQRYAQEIVREMDVILKQDERLTQQLQMQLVVPPGDKMIPSMDRITLKATKFGTGHLWDQLVLPWYQKHGVLSLGNFGPLLASNHVVCIHDANTFIFPESYSRTFATFYKVFLPVIAHRARKVATVSEFSAGMLVRHGVCSKEKLFIVYNGHEHALRWDASRADQRLINLSNRRYVLLLGSQAKHKNVDVVLSGAPALDAAGVDVVVVGGASGIFANGAREIRGGNIFYTGYVTDDELAALFENAMCFAFPSKTEGFGTPPLEAMVRGCPVICADAASLPEVGGDAILYANPDKPAEWTARILSLANSEELRTELVAKGKERAKMFSWKEGARIYIEQMLNLTSQESRPRLPV